VAPTKRGRPPHGTPAFSVTSNPTHSSQLRTIRPARRMPRNSGAAKARHSTSSAATRRRVPFRCRALVCPVQGLEAGDELPLGTVIAAGTAAELAKWLPCHGQELEIKHTRRCTGYWDQIRRRRQDDILLAGPARTLLARVVIPARRIPDAAVRRLPNPGRRRTTPPARPREFTVSLANWPGDTRRTS